MAPLTPQQLDLLSAARRAVLGTQRDERGPRLLPVCFAVDDDHAGTAVYTPLDEKPKSVSDPRRLARVRDIAARPQVSLLVDRWSEDWDELAWLRLEGGATLIEPTGASADEHARAVRLLRERYRQYAGHDLEHRPILRISVQRTTGWSAR